MHPNYDEGQRLPMKGGQRRTSRLAKNLAEIGEMALLRMLASAEMRISQLEFCEVYTTLSRIGRFGGYPPPASQRVNARGSTRTRHPHSLSRRTPGESGAKA